MLRAQIYLFSGLGADESVFQRLEFPGFSTTFIKWIAPKNKETIEDYATRLLDQITTPKPILIGLSFGGLIAVEIAKQLDTEKVILISSAKTKKEIPLYYRLAGMLEIHKLLPTSLLKSANFITYWFFEASTDTEKQILKQILKNTDPSFLKWAIDKIVHWKNRDTTKNLIQIHGSNDKILPSTFVNCTLTIKHGGHLMVLNKADELNVLLKKLL